jgi:hypothetical protein
MQINHILIGVLVVVAPLAFTAPRAHSAERFNELATMVPACKDVVSCLRVSRALNAERKACIEQGSQRACLVLERLHAKACEGDTDSDDCAMHR